MRVCGECPEIKVRHVGKQAKKTRKGQKVGENVSVRYMYCRHQEMEQKFISSKILHVAYILVPSPPLYKSTDVRY